MVPPSLLQSWSLTLENLYTAFQKIADENGNVNVEQFAKLQDYFPELKKLNITKLFKDNDLNSSGTLSYSDVTAIFSLYSIENCRALICPDIPKSLTNADLDTASLVIKEIKTLCEYAQTKKVKLMMGEGCFNLMARSRSLII